MKKCFTKLKLWYKLYKVVKYRAPMKVILKVIDEVNDLYPIKITLRK